MPTFRLQIQCDNAAFCSNDTDGDNEPAARGFEVARVLRQAASSVVDGLKPGQSGVLMDSNGNRVGSWALVSGARASRVQPGRGRQ